MLDYIYIILKREITVTAKKKGLVCYFARLIKSIFFLSVSIKELYHFFHNSLHRLMLYCSDNFTFDKMSGIISLIKRALKLLSLPHGPCSAFSKHGH